MILHKSALGEHTRNLNFMVATCIINIKRFIFQPMHTNYKILRLLKYLKL